MHREVGRAKDLSAPMVYTTYFPNYENGGWSQDVSNVSIKCTGDVSQQPYGKKCQMWPRYMCRRCTPSKRPTFWNFSAYTTLSIDPRNAFRRNVQSYGTSCTFLRNAFHFTEGGGGQKFSWINKGRMTCFCHGKLNPGLPWQKLHSARRRLFLPGNWT